MKALTLSCLLSFALLSCAAAADNDHAFAVAMTPEEAQARGLQVATFAGGCFWCVETAFEGLPGVKSVLSGFTGGEVRRPIYDQVSKGGTGHAEAVQVVFDPKVTSYERMLRVFWRNVDPFAAGRQFCDVGSQYRSAIFVHGPEQRRLAEKSKEEVAARFGQAVLTEIVDATTFWPAENYHQDFYRKDPIRYKAYRLGCGRDGRLRELWGAEAGHGAE